VDVLAPVGRVVAPLRSELDLSDADAIRTTVRDVRPAFIVNAAAYTAVDRAESDAVTCAAINAEAPRVLAEEAARLGAPMVHYSTDYVFDGSKRAPYREDDPAKPLNIYGATKETGDRAVADAGGRYLVLRTSWVYGAHGSNFLRTILKLAREREELRIIDDQTGAPTWSRRIAEATATLIARMCESEAAPSGTYHLTSSGSTTWYRFAAAILAGDPRAAEQVCRRLVPITSAEHGSPARRPRYSVLDNGKLARDFGISLPSWESELALVLAELRAQAG
jgi:dTDP-4-dehydrorhamnose reductase